MVGVKQCSGCEIAVVVDPRDARAGMYKLETAGDEKSMNKFSCIRPIVDGSLWRDKEVHEKAQDCYAVLTGCSIQVAAHEKLADELKTETFTLVFPSNCKLTDRHFVPMRRICG